MKFTIPENYDQYTLREIFQDLKLPKKDLHLLNMSKEITINDKLANYLIKYIQVIIYLYLRLMRKVIIYLVIVMHKFFMKMMILQSS